MPFDATLNSSYVGLSPQLTARLAKVGQKSVGKIINAAFDDRLTSEKEIRQLQFTRGRPSTQLINALWLRRFQTFRSETLNADIRYAPSGDDILRFLTSIVGKVVPRDSSQAVPGYSMINGGAHCLTNSLIFEYKDFHLSPHDNLRISSLIDTFVKQGRVTKNPSNMRHWAGIALVRAMAAALIRDASENGTLNWDVTLRDVLLLLMSSALQCRAGDITKNEFDDQPLPFIAYRDVALGLVGGSEIEHLTAVVTIRNEKGFKNDPSKNRTVRIASLAGTGNNICCVVKFLLAFALRLGNVAGDSVQGILSKADLRRDKMVVWVEPDMPIFPGLTNSGTGLAFDRPANNKSLRNVTAKAGKLAGILGNIASHDLRRGAAFDIAHTKPDENYTPVEMVAQSLGHSRHSTHVGTTDLYIGSSTRDVWTDRVLNPPQIKAPGDLRIAAEPYRVPRLSSTQLTEICRQRGFDASNRMDRKKASSHYRKEHFKNWIEAGAG